MSIFEEKSSINYYLDEISKIKLFTKEEEEKVTNKIKEYSVRISELELKIQKARTNKKYFPLKTLLIWSEVIKRPQH